MSEEEIRHLAKLSSLALSDNEVKKFAAEMKEIIEFCKQVNNINTDGLEISTSSQEKQNVFREDIVKECMNREKLISNCEEVENGMFKIPKVIN